MNQPAKDVLRRFFSAYFHQDWLCEATNADEILMHFASNAEVGEVTALASALSDYAKTSENDVELEAKLFREFGSYYVPSSDGISAKRWLEATTQTLARGEERN